MATIKQEQLYNEIIEYYSYADRLIKAVEDSSHKLSEQQFTIIEEAVTRLEYYADQLANRYIELVKGGMSSGVVEAIRQMLNDISAVIEECRSRMLMLYQA
ncbi:MAG: hypothetical protein FJX34_02540 [Alphaproteobacteria bacterium]|nr:hypothetical protein [Alphaproteobacteria bacterium]